MPKVVFAKAFRRHVECPDETVDADTVRAALGAYLERHPMVRSYVLDEQGGVRRHVAVFVGERQVLDRQGLGDALGEGDVLYVFQALSGG